MAGTEQQQMHVLKHLLCMLLGCLLSGVQLRVQRLLLRGLGLRRLLGQRRLLLRPLLAGVL